MSLLLRLVFVLPLFYKIINETTTTTKLSLVVNANTILEDYSQQHQQFFLRNHHGFLKSGDDNKINLHQEQQKYRELSELADSNNFVSYVPTTRVLDYANLDKDLLDIVKELLKDDYDGFLNALNIYRDGSHSKPYANITLDTPLRFSTRKGSRVEGHPLVGDKVIGQLMSEVVVRSSNENNNNVFIQMQYLTSDSSNVCQVGGSTKPIFDGCLVPTGSIIIGQNPPIRYTYDVKDDNLNELSIQKMSLNAEKTMHHSSSICDDNGNSETSLLPCIIVLYQDYENFYSYYGISDYANEWIMSAFDARFTRFITNPENYNYHSYDNNNGYNDEQSANDYVDDNGDDNKISRNTNFAAYSDIGRVEAIQAGIVYMNIWMYVIQQMESAVDNCYIYCSKNNDNDDRCDIDNVHHPWDAAVALYTGSLQENYNSLLLDKLSVGVGRIDSYDNNTSSSSRNGGGLLLFALANSRCLNFNTCDISNDDSSSSVQQSTPTAKVNFNVFKHFSIGQNNLFMGLCSDARENKAKIVSLMTVPLIQGALLYAYKIDIENDNTELSYIRGAAYAAAVIPIIHRCQPTDAEIIFQNMRLFGNDTVYSDGSGASTARTRATDFLQVKHAFERNYQCLGISCNDVGGLSDSRTEFDYSDDYYSYNNDQGYMEFAEPCNDDQLLDHHPVLHPGNIYNDEKNDFEGQQEDNNPGSGSNGSINGNNNGNSKSYSNGFNRNLPLVIGSIFGILFSALMITLLCFLTWKAPDNYIDHSHA